MRNLLLILLLANILYFVWEYVREDNPDEPGVAILEEADLGPPLVVAVEEEPDEAPVKTAGGEEGESPAPEAVVAAEDEDDEAAEPEEEAPATGGSEGPVALDRTCVTLGPFRIPEDAENVRSEYSSQGMKTALRKERGEIFVGHWVQVRDIPDRDTGDATVDALREGGIPEAYLVTTDDEGLKISLGVFGNRDGAERIKSHAQSLGYAAEITPRMADDGDYYFIDVALPPGRDSDPMVERYGEEKVQTGGLPTCPD